MKGKIYRILSVMFTLLLGLILAQYTIAQQPESAKKPMPKFPMRIEPDPRVEQRKYHFEDTNEDLSYVLYVSSKVSKDRKNPLIVALHGLGGDANFIVRDRLVDLAEEGGYIVVGPLGYNVGGWYGSPVIAFGGRPVEPPNLTELSEKDVMNVLNMMKKEFNVDENRTYLIGHSMGGAGALFLGQKYTDKWAAIAGIAPAAFAMLKNRAEILNPIRDAGIPVMIIQGEKDNVVPVNITRQWVDAMKELKMKHEYIEFPEGDHGTVISDGMPDIFRFFAGHTKAGKHEALESRVQALEDREEIRQLLMDYGRFLDQRDFGAFSGLFAKTEGEWIGGMGRAKGSQAIRELMESTIGKDTSIMQSCHLFTNETIHIDGDQATALTKWIFVVPGESNRPQLVFLGHYEDSMIRENGRWRFLRRVVRADIPSDNQIETK